MTIEELRLLIAQRKQLCHLELYDLSSGERTVLAEFKRVIEAPNFAPDGESLYFNCEGSIFRFWMEEKRIERVDTGFATDCNNDHVVSPDGKVQAVSHFTNEDVCSRIYTMPAEGGRPKLVTQNGPSYLHGWSPDGKSLVYCAERGGAYGIYRIDSSGEGERCLTSCGDLDDGPEYAPCGQSIWFNSTRSGLMQVWRMDADGSNPEQVSKRDGNCWFPHVSPDGSQVIYIEYRKGDVEPNAHPADRKVEIRIMGTNGENDRGLVSLDGGQGSLNVNSWAPDGKSFAFVSY